MAIEIVDFPIKNMVDLSIVFCKRLPDGNYLVINGKSTIFQSKFDVPSGDLNIVCWKISIYR